MGTFLREMSPMSRDIRDIVPPCPQCPPSPASGEAELFHHVVRISAQVVQ